MHCPECQHANPEGARFCNACGARLESACPACSHTSPPGSRFCNACGHALVPAAPSVSASFASPQSYTPKHLAEKILTTRSTLEGERKQVALRPLGPRDSLVVVRSVAPRERLSDHLAQMILWPKPRAILFSGGADAGGGGAGGAAGRCGGARHHPGGAHGPH